MIQSVCTVPTVESYIIEYETELGTELSVTDAAYRALVQLVDNVLKEDNHAYNRRLLMSRTVQATTSHHRKKETWLTTIAPMLGHRCAT